MQMKQNNLFGEEWYEDKTIKEAENNIIKEYIPFLKGIKTEDCFINIDNLEDLERIVKTCTLCGLRESCTQSVFGEGKSNAKLMLVGEGPGQEEDKQGVPFVGPAGHLLDKILQAVELSREEVYISNVFKCKPPKNRLVNPNEVKLCRSYLEAQIRLISPKLIVCLGSLATHTIMDSKVHIPQVRGKIFIRQDIKIIPTFHPANLLRNEGYKKSAWKDFKLIRDEYKKIVSRLTTNY